MIEGQVAAIVNSRELAINRGSTHGVKEGMKFDVYAKNSVPILDPETGVELGAVEERKIGVRIVRVEPTFSIGRTYEKTGGSDPLGIWSTSLLRGTPSTTRTLRTDEALFPPLTEAESYVKRGDVVRQLTVDD